GPVPAGSPASNKTPALRLVISGSLHLLASAGRPPAAIYLSFHLGAQEGHEMASSAVSFARDNQQKFLGELKDLLRIPSVSTAPEHKEDVRRAAIFVAGEPRRVVRGNCE